MIKLKLDSSQIDCSNDNALLLTVPACLKKTKIVDAVVKATVVTAVENENYSVKFSCVDGEKLSSWDNVDNITTAQGRILSIDISDELHEAINEGATQIKLTFTGSNNGIITFSSNSENDFIEIDYISLSEYRENGINHSVDLKNAGQLAVDLVGGELKLSTPISLSDNNVLPLNISNNFSSIEKNSFVSDVSKHNTLNVQQFLIKHASEDSLYFTYLDESGKEQIIEEKYYYLGENDNKIYVPRNQLNVDLNGKLIYKAETDFYAEDEPREVVSQIQLKAFTPTPVTNGTLSLKEFDTNANIASLCNLLKNIKTNYDMFSLYLVGGEYKCTDFNKEENLRVVKKDTGGTLIYTTESYTVYKYKLTFTNNTGVKVTLTIDHDPLHENQVSIVSPINNDNIATTSILSTQTVDCNYYKIESSPLDVNNVATSISFVKSNMLVEKEIHTYLESPLGLKLLSSIDDIQGSHLVEHEFEDLSNLRKQIKQLETSIKSTKDHIEMYQNQICALAIEKSFVEDEVSSNYEKYQENNDYLYEYYSKVFEDEAFYMMIEDYLKPEIYNYIVDRGADYRFYNTLSGSSVGDLTLSAKDIYNIDFQIDSAYMTILENETNLKELEDQLTKANHQVSLYELQCPVHYLYNDNNVIYGFGKTIDENIFRLILIRDMYDNSIIINYNSLENNKISNIINSKGKVISFNYEDDLLTITDDRDRITKIMYDGDMITSITRHDGTFSKYYYQDNHLIAVIDKSGFGAKISYNGDKVSSVESLSIIEKIEDSKILYKNGFDFDNVTSFDAYVVPKQYVNFDYKNYKSTTITDGNNKAITYLFDKIGRVTSAYENKFAENEEQNCVEVTTYSYEKDKVSLKVEKLPYSPNYLSDVCFSGEAFQDNDVLQLGALVCGVDDSSYQYQTHAVFHQMDETISSKVDSMTMSDENLNLINNLLTNVDCVHNTFVISGWAKADSARIVEDNIYVENYLKDRKFEIKIIVHYSDEETARDPVTQSFDWRNTEWQYCSVPIILENKQIQSIECVIDYSNNTGSIKYSDLEFREGNFSKVSYDYLDRAILQTYGHSKWETHYEYIDDSSIVSKEIVSNKYNPSIQFITQYDYDKNDRLIKTTDFNGIVTERIYNDKGICTKTIKYHKDEPSSKLYEEFNIDENGSISNNVNEFGEEVNKYEYINDTGILSAIQFPNGNKMVHAYDSSDKLAESSISIDGLNNTNTYGYTLDFLTSIKHNDFSVDYDYDSQGRVVKIKISGQDYLTRSYGDNEEISNLTTGETYRQTFDSKGNPLALYYNNSETPICQNIYDTVGNLIYIKDCSHGETIHNRFINSFGKVYKIESTQHNTSVTIEHSFDAEHQNVTKSSVLIGSESSTYKYLYNEAPDSQIESITLLGDNDEDVKFEQAIEYDKLGRIHKLNTLCFSDEFEYLKNGDHASNLVSNINFAINDIINDNIKYKYDVYGNITEIRKNNELLVRYRYDELSRIIREDNKQFNKTSTFGYDCGGNIVTKEEYPYTLSENLENGTLHLYTYPISGWRDRLCKHSVISKSTENGTEVVRQINEEFEYIGCSGNPSKYRNSLLSWSHGNQLDMIENKASFTYNVSGIRTSKTSNGFTTNYFLDGAKILEQKDALNTLQFYYGSNGLVGFHLKSLNNDGYVILDSDFFYKKNAQNDIIGIYASDGKLIARYFYDAWGNQKSQYFDESNNKFVDISNDFMYNDTSVINRFIAFKNPYRYRSYYYDFETGLYYLNSRYYDPELGRFINCDDINILNSLNDEINGLNLYTYCFNNPVNDIDTSGNWSLKKAFKKVKKFFSNAIDATVNFTENLYEHTIGNAIAGFRHGAETTFGINFDKPLTFFIDKPVGGDFWDWQFGFSINIGKFSLTSSMGLLDGKFSVGFGNLDLYLFAGLSGVGAGASYSRNGVSKYGELYMHILTFAVAVIGIASAPVLLPALGTMPAAASLPVILKYLGG